MARTAARKLQETQAPVFPKIQRTETRNFAIVGEARGRNYNSESRKKGMYRGKGQTQRTEKNTNYGTK